MNRTPDAMRQAFYSIYKVPVGRMALPPPTRWDDCHGLKRKNRVKLFLSLRAREGVAISWYCVRICTTSQEIATPTARNDIVIAHCASD